MGMAADRNFPNHTHCGAVLFPTLFCSRSGENFPRFKNRKEGNNREGRNVVIQSS